MSKRWFFICRDEDGDLMVTEAEDYDTLCEEVYEEWSFRAQYTSRPFDWMKEEERAHLICGYRGIMEDFTQTLGRKLAAEQATESAEAERERESAERAEYERLKAKFEGTPDE
jgi:hypothetical protein